ncbi:hypothetical protein JOC33_000197 [Thalassobacillus pellis]|nr:hypothetical protein [Thalassobacillus pellis]
MILINIKINKEKKGIAKKTGLRLFRANITETIVMTANKNTQTIFLTPYCKRYHF